MKQESIWTIVINIENVPVDRLARAWRQWTLPFSIAESLGISFLFKFFFFFCFICLSIPIKNDISWHKLTKQNWTLYTWMCLSSRAFLTLGGPISSPEFSGFSVSGGSASHRWPRSRRTLGSRLWVAWKSLRFGGRKLHGKPGGAVVLLILTGFVSSVRTVVRPGKLFNSKRQKNWSQWSEHPWRINRFLLLHGLIILFYRMLIYM